MLIRLKASSGQYVCAKSGGGQGLLADRPSASTWETFNACDLANDSLMSGDQIQLASWNGQFICAEGGGGGAVNANRQVPHEWETFTISLATGSGGIATGSLVSLRTYDGHFVCAEGGGGREVVANRTVVGPWETFTIELVGGVQGPHDESYYRMHLPDVPEGIEPDSITVSRG